MGTSKVSWDKRLLFAPLETLTARGRLLAVLGGSLLTLLWCALLNGNLLGAFQLPDVAFYMDMARWRYDLVPAPFSSRPLAPWLAAQLTFGGRLQLTTGFTALAYASLASSLLLVLWLLVRSRAPRWSLLAVVAIPFWPKLLSNAGLPDPLYTVLLALLLLALEKDRLYVAAAMMLPLMLARESTWLTLACLLVVGWRQLRWGPAFVAIAGAVLGAAVVHHLSLGSLPNPEHLSGPLYMVGKVAANAGRSLGLVPWSNVYPMLCGTPAWQHAVHLGAVRSVGFCTWNSEGPFETFGGLLTIFGALPVLLFALLLARRVAPGPSSLLLRFCLLYGTVSLLLAPALGTWYVRLFGYAWPLLLVALPRLLPNATAQVLTADRHAVLWGFFVVLHLLVCAAGNTKITGAWLLTIAALQLTWAALLLVHCRRSSNVAI